MISCFEVEELLKSVFNENEDDELHHLIGILKSRDRNRRVFNWFTKSLAELMTSNKERVMSYIKYPEDHLRVISPMQHWCINSLYCSLPTGSEDTSFKILRKNEFEDKLFKCEDDIYENDVIINMYSACIETMEEIKRQLESQKNGENISLLDQKLFQPARLSAIYHYYNERAEEVFEYLKTKPLRTVDTILPKLL